MGFIAVIHYPSTENARILDKNLAEFRRDKVLQHIASLELNDSARNILLQNIKNEVGGLDMTKKVV